MIITKEHPNVGLYQSVHLVVTVTADLIVKEILGTCFSINPRGLFLTAAHIFPFFEDERYRDRQHEVFGYRPPSQAEQKTSHIAVYRNMMDGTAKLYGVTRVQLRLDQDFALIYCESDLGAPKTSHFDALVLSDATRKGLPVAVVGYTNNQMTLGETIDGRQRVSIEGGLSMNLGYISEIYPEKKNDSTNWYPCFDSTAQMTSGQSGGPTIDGETGKVIGINSYSGSDSSTSATLSDAFDTKIMDSEFLFTDTNGVTTDLQNKTLRELAKIGIIRIN